MRSFWGVGVAIMGTLAVRSAGLDADNLAEAKREDGRADGMWKAAAPFRATSRSTPAAQEGITLNMEAASESTKTKVNLPLDGKQTFDPKKSRNPDFPPDPGLGPTHLSTSCASSSLVSHGPRSECTQYLRTHTNI